MLSKKTLLLVAITRWAGSESDTRHEDLQASIGLGNERRESALSAIYAAFSVLSTVLRTDTNHQPQVKPPQDRHTELAGRNGGGVPRSAAMAMVGHKTEAIYRRYAIADESMLRDGAHRLAALHNADASRKIRSTVISFHKA